MSYPLTFNRLTLFLMLAVPQQSHHQKVLVSVLCKYCKVPYMALSRLTMLKVSQNLNPNLQPQLKPLVLVLVPVARAVHGDGAVVAHDQLKRLQRSLIRRWLTTSIMVLPPQVRVPLLSVEVRSLLRMEMPWTTRSSELVKKPRSEVF